MKGLKSVFLTIIFLINSVTAYSNDNYVINIRNLMMLSCKYYNYNKLWDDWYSTQHREFTQSDIDNEVYIRYLTNTIPKKFIKTFLKNTNNDIPLGLEILGIADHESNWSIMLGKINDNGSVDMGPMHLNSYNITNKNFMEKFDYNITEKEKRDSDLYYFALCINFFSQLRKEYVTLRGALMHYNGGPKIKDALPGQRLYEITNTYASVVNNKISKRKTAWNTYYRNNFNKVKNNIEVDYINAKFIEFIGIINDKIESLDKNKNFNNIIPLYKAGIVIAFSSKSLWRKEEYDHHLIILHLTKCCLEELSAHDIFDILINSFNSKQETRTIKSILNIT